MQRSIVWKGLDADTHEVCLIHFHDGHITIHSEITGWAEGKPVSVEYYIKLNSNWNVTEFDVKAQTGLAVKHYAMKYEKGAWLDNGSRKNKFDNCRFIDITLTPLTNSLPINNLPLNVGGTSEIEVVYIDVLERDIRVDKQWYTKLGEQKYRFKNSFGFTADIDVDNQGFVTAYPQLFKMI